MIVIQLLYILLFVNLCNLQAFFNFKLFKKRTDLNINSNTINNNSEIISNLKAKEIKQILIQNNINTKALFDRNDLVQALIELESQWSNKAISNQFITPIHISRYGVTLHEYTAIDIYIKNQKLRFLVDTGSSVNLIKYDLATKFDLFKTGRVFRNNNVGNGVGGGGKMTNNNQISFIHPIQLYNDNTNTVTSSSPTQLQQRLIDYPGMYIYIYIICNADYYVYALYTQSLYTLSLYSALY